MIARHTDDKKTAHAIFIITQANMWAPETLIVLYNAIKKKKIRMKGQSSFVTKSRVISKFYSKKISWNIKFLLTKLLPASSFDLFIY